MTEPRPFHRIFGLTWVDLCDGSDITVETEQDLSLRQQFVDMVLRRTGDRLPSQLPDGFGNLGRINLVSFKSYQEAMDWWALCELIGHFVNHRKQNSPSAGTLIPVADYRLIAVSSRYPQNLSQLVEMPQVSPGVYEISVLTLTIRVIVLNQLPKHVQNAMLHLFSANTELIRYGQEHYRPRTKDISTVLHQLLAYPGEEKSMTDAQKALLQQTIEEMWQLMPPEFWGRFWRATPVEERLKALPPEERLKGLPPEERLKGLSPDDVLNAMSPEMVAQLAQKLKDRAPATNP